MLFQVFRVSLLLSALLAAYSAEGVSKGQHLNAPYFNVFCRILKVVEDPKLPPPPTKALATIQAALVKLTLKVKSSEWLNNLKTGKIEEASKSPGDEILKRLTKSWDMWNTSLSQLFSGEGEKPPEISSLSRKAAEARIVQILAQAVSIQDSIEAKSLQTSKEQIEQALRHAAFKEKNSAEEAIGLIADGQERKNTCSRVVTHGRGGDSIPVDILCLCAAGGGTGNNQKDFCGKGIGGTGAGGTTNGWTSTSNDAESLKNLWKTHIQKKCQERGASAGVEELPALLLQAHSLIDRGATCVVENHEVAGGALFGGIGHFGKSSNCQSLSFGSHLQQKCEGEISDAKGACVGYTADAGNHPDPAWLVGLEEQSGPIHDYLQKTAEVRQDLARLHILVGRTEEIFEEAKMDSEPPTTKDENQFQNRNISHNQKPTTSADKPSAHEASSLSSTTIQRFLLPWPLLI